MTDQGDQLAAASYPNPNDAKATLGVLVDDALNQSASTSRSEDLGSIFMNPVTRLRVSHQQALYGAEFLLILSA